jgi:hypothetical protein
MASSHHGGLILRDASLAMLVRLPHGEARGKSGKFAVDVELPVTVMTR